MALTVTSPHSRFSLPTHLSHSISGCHPRHRVEEKRNEGREERKIKEKGRKEKEGVADLGDQRKKKGEEEKRKRRRKGRWVARTGERRVGEWEKGRKKRKERKEKRKRKRERVTGGCV